MKHTTLVLALASALTVSPVAFADKASATSSVAEARVLIRAAERSGAEQHAITELKLARDHYTAATGHIDERDWTDAEIAANKSQRDAEVADAKTRAVKSEQALNSIQEVVRTLRAELQRQGGGQ